MRTTRTMAMAVGAALLATGLFAAPSVEITSVQQQYPWTNTVDIVYNVAGVESETNGYFVVFTPTTSTGAAIPDVNGEKSVQVALKGSGVYSTQWFPQTNQQYTACKMTPSVFRGAAKDYMIVDLLTGEVTYEPMATQEASNQRYNTDEYKTKKLVLRRIVAGPHVIGPIPKRTSTQNITVNMPRDYYYGIFQATEAQYERIMGLTSKLSSKLPEGASRSSWNAIRGNALSAAKPTTGVMKRLSDLTGIDFDLPTEAMQWVAHGAGVTTKYVQGDTATEAAVAEYGWFGLTGTAKHRYDVGLKKPNAWGIFDILGNVWEYSRDLWYDGSDLESLIAADGQAPITKGTASQCAECYGPYDNGFTDESSVHLRSRTNISKGEGTDRRGFRFSAIKTWD